MSQARTEGLNMRLSITHQTQYRYGIAVETSHHLAHLTPVSRPTQVLVGHQMVIDPAPSDRTERTDAFGNQVTQWTLPFVHHHLNVTTQSEIQTRGLPDAQSEITCHQAQERLRYVALQNPSPAAAYLGPSIHVPWHPDLADYAAPDFTGQRPLIEAALAFMRRMHTEMVYDNSSTQVDTPAPMALSARKGVCQDFAHIMLGGLRQMGLAACYVSGYLLTKPAPGQLRVVGGDASHAWVALHIPGLENHPSLGWLHLDPTNQRHGWGSPGADYVIIAQGRDFADVSPLRGVLLGGDATPPQVDVAVQLLAKD